MKAMLLVLSLMINPVFAETCVNISGRYEHKMPGVDFEFKQNGCQTLEHRYCFDAKCSDEVDYFSLDGELSDNGGPTNWSYLKIDGKKIHRKNHWSNGILHNDKQCYWNESWYSKLPNGDLKIEYKLECDDYNGNTDIIIDEVTYRIR